MWAHLGALLTGLAGAVLSAGVLSLFAWVVPAVIRGQQGTTSGFVRHHATESLNFQLSHLIYGVVGIVLATFVAIVTFGLALFAIIPAALMWVVLVLIWMIQGCSAASGGRPYRYPLTIRFFG